MRKIVIPPKTDGYNSKDYEKFRSKIENERRNLGGYDEDPSTKKSHEGYVTKSGVMIV